MATHHSYQSFSGEKPSTELLNPNKNGLQFDPHHQKDQSFGSTGNRGQGRYGDPISRMRSSDDFTLNNKDSDPSLHGKDSKAQLTKEEIRRRIKQKHRSKIPGHVKWTKWMHTESKNHTVAVIGEFVGTTLFLFFAFAGTQLANYGKLVEYNNEFSLANLLYISAAFGFGLMVNAWIFFRISGGLFNPAVTLALFLLRALNPLRAALLVFAQMGGACFAAYLVKVMYPTPLNVQTKLGDGVTIAQGLFIEAMCTAQLVFTIIMLAKEKHKATFMAPIGIGFALFIGELAAVFYTGGSLNPARSFGPAAVLHSFDAHHWIYWVGPIIGTLLAVVFYRLIKILEYEMANPGQDGDFENDPTQNPDHELAQVVEERQAEVQEIQAIQQQGGFQTLRDSTLPDQPNVLGNQGVIGMTVEGIRAGDEVRVQRVRPGADDDLEAQWPATDGVHAPAAKDALAKEKDNPATSH